MDIFTVSGSHGAIDVNATTGEALQIYGHDCNCDECRDGFEDWPIRFDVEGYKKAYGIPSLIDLEIDILLIGYWDNMGNYVEPINLDEI